MADSRDDLRYQDLRQENAILRQELTDLYSHLMIIEDTDEKTADNKTKISSAGRLIVYDKQKRDTEVLLMKEAQRQQIVLLEKELLFQQTHMKEQVLKAKILEEKLTVANERIATMDLEAVNAIPHKMKLKELSASVQEQTSRLESMQKTNNELTSECVRLKSREQLLQAQLGACEARRDEWQSTVEPLNRRVAGSSRNCRHKQLSLFSPIIYAQSWRQRARWRKSSSARAARGSGRRTSSIRKRRCGGRRRRASCGTRSGGRSRRPRRLPG